MSKKLNRDYPAIDLEEVGKTMRMLHDRVVSQRHRVHVTRDDCDEVCIMISKCELESLEQALEIFADTQVFTEMCKNLQDVLKAAAMVYPAPGNEQDSSAYAD